MSARMFALTFGIIYVVVALLELLVFKEAPTDTAFLLYSPVHNTIHWVAGLLGLLAYWQGAQMSRLYAQVFGVIFLLVAILGFIPGQPVLSTILNYQVNMLYNIVHLITGILGVWAGFGAMEADGKKA